VARECRIAQADRSVGGYWSAAFAATTFASLSQRCHSGEGA
jgi:hypothetical protein